MRFTESETLYISKTPMVMTSVWDSMCVWGGTSVDINETHNYMASQNRELSNSGCDANLALLRLKVLLGYPVWI